MVKILEESSDQGGTVRVPHQKGSRKVHSRGRVSRSFQGCKEEGGVE